MPRNQSQSQAKYRVGLSVCLFQPRARIVGHSNQIRETNICVEALCRFSKYQQSGFCPMFHLPFHIDRRLHQKLVVNPRRFVKHDYGHVIHYILFLTTNSCVQNAHAWWWQLWMALFKVQHLLAKYSPAAPEKRAGFLICIHFALQSLDLYRLTFFLNVMFWTWESVPEYKM